MEILWWPKKEANGSSVSLMAALPSNCTLLPPCQPTQKIRNTVTLQPFPTHLQHNMTETWAERTDKYLEPFSQCHMLASIWATARAHRGGSRKLIDKGKVLCMICSSGSCCETLSYCFADLTLISPSITLLQNYILSFIACLQRIQLISIAFFKAFHMSKANAVTAFSNTSILCSLFLKT